MRRRRHRITLSERRATVDALQLADVAIARFEHPRIVVCWDVPTATHDVVDVLALGSRSLTPARTQAELVVRHEVGPLGYEPGLAVAGRVGGGVDDSADRVAEIVGSVRVELSTVVALGDQDGCEISHAGHLNVVAGAYKVGSLDRSVRDQTGSVAIGGTVGNTRTFLLTNRTVLCRTPETEILETVDPSSLTARVLVPSVAGARIVAGLRLTTRLPAFAGFDSVGTHVLVGKRGVGVGRFGLPLRP